MKKLIVFSLIVFFSISVTSVNAEICKPFMGRFHFYYASIDNVMTHAAHCYYRLCPLGPWCENRDYSIPGNFKPGSGQWRGRDDFFLCSDVHTSGDCPFYPTS